MPFTTTVRRPAGLRHRPARPGRLPGQPSRRCRPAHGTEILLSAASADDGGCAQVDHFARQLGVSVENDLAYDGHYRAVRSFGPVGYRMTAISEAAMARYHAADTYYGYVTPTPPDTWT